MIDYEWFVLLVDLDKLNISCFIRPKPNYIFTFSEAKLDYLAWTPTPIVGREKVFLSQRGRLKTKSMNIIYFLSLFLKGKLKTELYYMKNGCLLLYRCIASSFFLAFSSLSFFSDCNFTFYNTFYHYNFIDFILFILFFINQYICFTLPFPVVKILF